MQKNLDINFCGCSVYSLENSHDCDISANRKARCGDIAETLDVAQSQLSGKLRRVAQDARRPGLVLSYDRARHRPYRLVAIECPGIAVDNRIEAILAGSPTRRRMKPSASTAYLAAGSPMPASFRISSTLASGSAPGSTWPSIISKARPCVSDQRKSAAFGTSSGVSRFSRSSFICR